LDGKKFKDIKPLVQCGRAVFLRGIVTFQGADPAEMSL